MLDEEGRLLEKDRPVAPSEIASTRKLICHQCGAVNPPKAYCCLNCFKVLRPKADVPFWRVAMRPSISAVVILAACMLAGLVVMKRWIDKLEARVSMDLKTADYNISVVADKKRKGLLGSSDDAAAIEAIDAAESGKAPAAPPAEAPAAAPASQ
jgi:ribosomal protein L40E